MPFDSVWDAHKYATESGLVLDVPYVPSDEQIVDAMLKLARVGPGDMLYDLGCGDGRILVAAAMKTNTHGIGVDKDPARIADAMEYAASAGIEYMVNFIEGDLLEVDFRDATVVMLYLLDEVNLQLRPRLLNELRPGTRIVSHAFDMGDWPWDKRISVGGTRLLKWVVPAQVAGAWQWASSEGDIWWVELEQHYQKVTGHAWFNDQPAEIESASLRGEFLTLVLHRQGSEATNHYLLRCRDGEMEQLEGDF